MKKEELKKLVEKKRRIKIYGKDILKLEKIIKDMKDKDFRKNATIELIIDKNDVESQWFSAERIDKKEWRTKICGLTTKELTVHGKKYDTKSFSAAVEFAADVYRDLQKRNKN